MAGALIAAGPTPRPSPPPPRRRREAFDRGRTAFVRAEYKRAIEILRPLLYPEHAARQRGRDCAGAPHARRGVPVREQARRGAARVQEAAGAAPGVSLRSAAGLRSGWSTSSTASEGRGSDHRRSQGARAGSASRRPRSARAKPRASACRPPSSATNGIRSRSTSSRSAPASSRTASARKGWCFLGTEAALGAMSLGAFVDQLRRSTAWRRTASAPTEHRRRRSARGIDRPLAGGHARAADRRAGGQRRPVLRGRDLGRHRRHPQLSSTRSPLDRTHRQRPARARAPGADKFHDPVARRPRRRLAF